MADEQFHEFHLDGKQMVFLFMATTVVAVVIFLCGVMVGRGVRATRVEPVVLAAPEVESPETDLAESLDGDPGDVSPPVPTELKYSERLRSKSPAPERLRETPPQPARSEVVASPVPEAPVPAPKAETRTKPESQAQKADDGKRDEFAEPSGPGYAVQVASLGKEADAKATGRTLRAKKYPVFITETPTLPKRYRVRVGKYQMENEARAVLARLEKTEGFHGAWLVPR